MSAGEFRLQSTDPSAKPLLDYRYLEDEFDRRRMREMIRLAARLFEHPAFRDIVTERNEPTDDELADDDLLDAFIARDITTGQHTCGTCKMGPCQTRWRWWISTARSTGFRGCASSMLRSCQIALGPTRT